MEQECTVHEVVVKHIWDQHDEPVASLVLEQGFQLTNTHIHQNGTIQLTIKKETAE